MSSPQIRKLVNKRKQTTIESSFLPDPDHPGANLQLSHNGSSESLHRQPSLFLFFCSPWEQFLKLTQAVSFWVRGRSRTLKKTHGITIVNHHLTVRSSFTSRFVFCQQPESELFPKPRSQITVMCRGQPCLSSLRELSAVRASSP